MDFGCPGVRGGGGGVRYNKTNMTSLWGCQHDSLPLVSIVNYVGNPTGVSYVYSDEYKTLIFARRNKINVAPGQKQIRICY